ncbi:MAG: LCP family protein [Thermacetogeniaceae bacterium]|nr:LCP family protein [Syntrophomonadaceae bacterium]
MNHGDWEETREWKVINVLQSEPGTGKVKKVPRSWRRSGCGCIVFILLFLLAAVVITAGLWGLLKNVLTPGTDSKESVAVLVMGIDREKANEPGRSDTMMVAFLNSKDKKVNLLSIPRDTYTEVPARGGKDKINSAYAAGGPEAALEAVSLLLNREIKYYLATDLQGFVKIVDTLGGVTVEVDEAASKGLGIPPGTHRLQGEEALRFVRYRGYPMADIERINHQQVFLQALVDEALQLRHIGKTPALIRETQGAVDTNLSTVQLMDFAIAFKGMSSSQMECKTLPGTPKYINGISYWIPYTDQIEPLVEELSQVNSSES